MARRPPARRPHFQALSPSSCCPHPLAVRVAVEDFDERQLFRARDNATYVHEFDLASLDRWVLGGGFCVREAVCRGVGGLALLEWGCSWLGGGDAYRWGSLDMLLLLRIPACRRCSKVGVQYVPPHKSPPRDCEYWWTFGARPPGGSGGGRARGQGCA